jgi:hypothetical protein
MPLFAKSIGVDLWGWNDERAKPREIKDGISKLTGWEDIDNETPRLHSMRQTLKGFLSNFNVLVVQRLHVYPICDCEND